MPSIISNTQTSLQQEAGGAAIRVVRSPVHPEFVSGAPVGSVAMRSVTARNTHRARSWGDGWRCRAEVSIDAMEERRRHRASAAGSQGCSPRSRGFESASALPQQGSSVHPRDGFPAPSIIHQLGPIDAPARPASARVSVMHCAAKTSGALPHRLRGRREPARSL